MELIDIYDANMRLRGRMPREEAHQRGEWHRTVYLWLVSAEQGGALFLQRRGPNVAANPGKLDATVAGHLLAGEDELSGLREVREELGIELPSEVHHLGYRTEVMDLPNGIRNREFQAIFMAPTAMATAELAPDPSEVEGVFAIGLSDLFQLIEGSVDEVEAHGSAFGRSACSWRPASCQISLSSFVQRFTHYYLNVAIMAERLLEGRRPLAIG